MNFSNKESKNKHKTPDCIKVEDLVENIKEVIHETSKKTKKEIDEIDKNLNEVKKELDSQNTNSSKDSWLKSPNLQLVFNYAKDLSTYSFIKRSVFSALAGFFVGISYLVYVIIKASFYSNGIAPAPELIALSNFIGSLMFPFAIFAIIYLGGNLFTSNSLMYVAVFKKIIRIKYFLYQLILTWFFNFVGSLVMVGISYLILWDNLDAQDVAYKIASSKLTTEWWSTLASGFICNIIITGCIYGYKVIPSKTVGFLFVYLLIVFFALSGFQHTVANMYIVPLGLSYWQSATVSAGEAWGALFYYNLLPVSFSNTLGGMIIPVLYIVAESKFSVKGFHKKKKVITEIKIKNEDPN
ncbi:MAG: formate/nitrite transporter family protein [Malacoplasma sp.]